MTSAYFYAARTRLGRALRGTLDAESIEHALAHLHGRSLYVTSLEPITSAGGMVRSLVFLKRVDRGSLTTLFRSLATMIAAGVTLRKALTVAIDTCANERLREALESIASEVESGSSLSLAMERRGHEFPRLFAMMIRAAETAGVLDAALLRVADLLEREGVMRARIYAALTYPAIIAIASIGLVLFLLAKTMPSFAAMFAQLHVPLPRSTALLIGVGDVLGHPANWWGGLAGIVALACIVRWLRSLPAVRERYDLVVQRLPLVGRVVRNINIARFARTLGTMLVSGVNVEAALGATRDVLGNGLYARHVDEISTSIRAGGSVAMVMGERGFFDPLFMQLVRVGEETGSLDQMLLRLAEHHERAVESALSTASDALEPILILLLGAVVGTIVSSILVPLYSIIGSIK